MATPPQSPIDDLVDDVREAVRCSIALINAARPNERMCGYALCTDDDASTLYHVACSREFCARQAAPEVAWVFVDWEYNEGDDLFDRPRRLLVGRKATVDSSDAHWRHVESAFRDLTAALLVARTEALVPSDTLLLVSSTDPGRQTQRLAAEAARLLNPDDLAAEWVSAMGWS